MRLPPRYLGRTAFLWYTDPMPQTPEERRKTFEALAEKRRELLERERETQLTREREHEERTARQKAASIAEQQAAAERGNAREEWRQEQHTKKEEALEAARLAAEERARQEAKAAAEEADREERAQRMRELHDRAVTQKVAARKLQAQHIEEETAKRVDDQLERDLRDVQHVLDRTLEHLVQDRRRKIAQLEDDALRQQKAMVERYEVRKAQALREGGPKGGADVYHVTSEHKRALLTLQERTAGTRAKIESEYNRLKDEAVAQAEQKRARLRGLADQRVREAKVRHENADKWIDSHRS